MPTLVYKTYTEKIQLAHIGYYTLISEILHLIFTTVYDSYNIIPISKWRKLKFNNTEQLVQGQIACIWTALIVVLSHILSGIVCGVSHYGKKNGV